MAVDIRTRFGRAIRRIHEEQEIDQEEAADRCGLHRTYYSGIERGVRNVSLVNIEKVAKGLKTSLPDLFRRVQPSRSLNRCCRSSHSSEFPVCIAPSCFAKFHLCPRAIPRIHLFVHHAQSAKDSLFLPEV